MLRVDVIALAGVGAVDAYDIDMVLVDWPHVGAVYIRPRGTELHLKRSRWRDRSILDLHANELAIAIRDEVEGRVFAKSREDHEALIREIANRVRDANVALVLRVVRPHNWQNTRLPVRYEG